MIEKLDCGDRSTRRRQPTATLDARSRSSPGRSWTWWTSSRKRPGSEPMSAHQPSSLRRRLLSAGTAKSCPSSIPGPWTGIDVFHPGELEGRIHVGSYVKAPWAADHHRLRGGADRPGAAGEDQADPGQGPGRGPAHGAGRSSWPVDCRPLPLHPRCSPALLPAPGSKRRGERVVT